MPEEENPAPEGPDPEPELLPDDSSPAGGAEPVPVELPEKPDPENWESRFKYLLADFENFRKRSDRETFRSERAARAAVLKGLLPLYEAFERAREAVARLPAKDPIRQGLDLLAREWVAFLKTEGVEPVARPGVPFKAETMEAVAEARAGSSSPDGFVVEVVQQGYRFADGLLRPAKVVVARVPTSVTSGEAESAEGEPPSGSPVG